MMMLRAFARAAAHQSSNWRSPVVSPSPQLTKGRMKRRQKWVVVRPWHCLHTNTVCSKYRNVAAAPQGTSCACCIHPCSHCSGANQVKIQLRRQAKSVYSWDCSVGMHSTSTSTPEDNQSRLWCLADEQQKSALLLDPYLWSDPSTAAWIWGQRAC